MPLVNCGNQGWAHPCLHAQEGAEAWSTRNLSLEGLASRPKPGRKALHCLEPGTALEKGCRVIQRLHTLLPPALSSWAPMPGHPDSHGPFCKTVGWASPSLGPGTWGEQWPCQADSWVWTCLLPVHPEHPQCQAGLPQQPAPSVCLRWDVHSCPYSTRILSWPPAPHDCGKGIFPILCRPAVPCLVHPANTPVDYARGLLARAPGLLPPSRNSCLTRPAVSALTPSRPSTLHTGLAGPKPGPLWCLEIRRERPTDAALIKVTPAPRLCPWDRRGLARAASGPAMPTAGEGGAKVNKSEPHSR